MNRRRSGLLSVLVILLLGALAGCPSLIDLVPQAAITASPTSGQAPLTVTFEASGFSDEQDPIGDEITSHEWDFGDGATATGKQVTHTYTSAGTFTVTLTVTDDDGETDTATTSIEVTSAGEATAYVSNGLEGSVSIINVNEDSTTDDSPVTVGNGPRGVAVTPDGSTAYVANNNDNSVSVIDTTTNTVNDTVNVGDGPTGVAVTPDGSTSMRRPTLSTGIGQLRASPLPCLHSQS